MTPADRDIQIVRGDYYVHVVEMEDSHVSYSFDASLTQGASVGPVFDVDHDGNTVTVSLEPAVTEALALRPYHWRLRRLDEQGRPETLIVGTVRVT